MSNYELLKLYYFLDGCAWNACEKLALFRSKAAAEAFLENAEGWTVNVLV